MENTAPAEVTMSALDMQNQYELQTLKKAIESDENLVGWMEKAWSAKHTYDAGQRLPGRFRKMAARGHQIRVQIPVMPVPSPEHIESVRQTFVKRIAELESLKKEVEG